jgi:hypothetical protein
MDGAAMFLNEHAVMKGIQVIFRTSVPGHFKCDWPLFAPPLRSREEAEKYVAKGEQGFYWGKIHSLNKIAMASFTQKGAEILDAYGSSVMRWDGHMGDGDCLHYCMGGTAYDSWVLFLQNHLIGHAKRRQEASGRTLIVPS